MKTALKYLLILGGIALLSFVFYSKVYIPKTTYITLHPTLGEIEEKVQGIGNINAHHIYNITAQTGGKILKLLTDSGSWVKKGDLLLVMDGVDLHNQVEIAQTNLRKVNEEHRSIEAQRKGLNAQKSLALATYHRYKNLKKQGFVTQAEYDKVTSELSSVESTIQANHAQIASAKEVMVMAQKSVDALLEKMKRLNVYAPVDGYVISREAEVAQTILPSQAILKIVDPKTLWIVTKIDERISEQIKLNQKATIFLRSQPNKKYTGFVKRMDAISDAVTLEREVNIAFDTLPEPFYINEQAEVKIAVKEYTQVVKIPLNVVVQENGKLGVWLVNKNRATFKVIKKIAQDDKDMAVTNIEKEAQIIIPNLSKKLLKEGMKIHL
ncbi:efflux RND transporter periplasmic adaptor subunit [bacterium]|nr:efflux RND transporter periplasmic adaptor subunit [bacterium]MBU1956781.1 efflux RND transporter periplasmic adaptor subunit [bacterium]